jgi:antitoxin YefM
MATRIDLVEDVLPISELRLRAAQQIEKIQNTRRPLVITQYGKAVAVLMEVSQFQLWQDRLSLLEERLASMEKELALRPSANHNQSNDNGDKEKES